MQVKEIIQKCLDEKLTDKKYHVDKASKFTRELADTIKQELKGQLRKNLAAVVSILLSIIVFLTVQPSPRSKLGSVQVRGASGHRRAAWRGGQVSCATAVENALVCGSRSSASCFCVWPDAQFLTGLSGLAAEWGADVSGMRRQIIKHSQRFPMFVPVSPCCLSAACAKGVDPPESKA